MALLCAQLGYIKSQQSAQKKTVWEDHVSSHRNYLDVVPPLVESQGKLEKEEIFCFHCSYLLVP
jgi:hypothetical protein